MVYQFVSDLSSFMQEKFEKFPANTEIEVEICPPDMSGDLTINCFKFAKFCGNPIVAANAVSEYLKTHKDIDSVEVIKAFVNVSLKGASLLRDTLADVESLFAKCILKEDEKKRILIEFSAPNTNKPQHLGHVRNNVIGMSLAKLLKRVGNDVIEINLVNDRGIHICKSMIAYMRWGNGVTPESSKIKGDHLVGNFYVKYNQELEKELKTLRQDNTLADKSDDELFLQTELGLATQKMLQDWEANNAEVRKLWELMNSWVFAGFAQTYKRMGIEFDHTYLESNTYLLGKDIVEKGLSSGVFAKRDDGAIFADLGKLGPKVVLRSDGTSVYITQDLGTTLLKYDDYKPDSMIWVVGDEQNLHFKMLFEIMKKLSYPWAEDLFHLSYGMVNLPSGKMKSREGTVVDADDLFDEMVSLSKQACLERNSEDSNVDAKAEIIGLGALKFMLLKFNPKTTIMFDPEASLKFEGDTGPYIQYVAARINSIERKALEKNIDINKVEINWNILGNKEEKNLAVISGCYPDILKLSASRKDCSGLTEYLLNLAKAFNRFYRECPVLTAENEELVIARLALAINVRKILVDGLDTLTIAVPESM